MARGLQLSRSGRRAGGLHPGAGAKTGKNRVHLDLASHSAAHQAELVSRARDLGGAPVDIGQGDVPWAVMADPEGNEFCVLEPRDIYRDTGPVAAILTDCADPAALAPFWAGAAGWEITRTEDDIVGLRSPAGTGPYLEFLRVPDQKKVKNRLHPDVAPYRGDDPAAEVARLRAAGAALADVGQGGEVSWTVLADPEGNRRPRSGVARRRQRCRTQALTAGPDRSDRRP